MFRLAALIPSPPLLVPELCGGSPVADDSHPAAQVPALREAVLSAARTLAESAERWTIVGVGNVEQVLGPDTVGTFRGFGADVRVALSPAALGDPGQKHAGISGGRHAGMTGGQRAGMTGEWAARMTEEQAGGLTGSAGTTGERAPGMAGERAAGMSGEWGRGADPWLPLSVLIGGWVRGRVAPGVAARGRVVAGDAGVEHCLAVGAKLRGELDADDADHGVLVVADGAATLSIKAPGYLDPRAAGVQDGIDRALATGDRAALAELDSGLCAELEVSGRAAYQVLAGLFEVDERDPSVETRYAAAPFGVGYQVSVWRPGGGR
ncbi:class III extradiol ring-cleavage dioxygenase family protein [Nocardia terpenica]|uniref:hypothetical protein n=1 Tax=Nocardia terpenica TaxID=455432 RepID=UPI0012FD8391|nr:hypothetical protein [Nocardia terpenica]